MIWCMSSWLRSGGDWKTFRAWVAFLAWKDVATTWHTICHPWGGLRWAKNEDIQLGWHTARGQKMWIAEACLQTCGMGLEYGLICGASREHCGKLGQLSCLMSTTVVGHLVWHLAWGNLQCTRLLSMKWVSRKRARHVTQAKQVSKAPRHAQMQQGNRWHDPRRKFEQH